MYYVTIENLEKRLRKLTPKRYIISAWRENKWVVAKLNTGIRIKFRDF